MKSKLLVLAIAALPALGATGAALAASKHHSRHQHIYRPAPAVASAPVVPQWAAPRMIEARPGLWISSYDCITDDGAGRWRPCSSLGGGGARP
jgi:hypothetical protein